MSVFDHVEVSTVIIINNTPLISPSELQTVGVSHENWGL